MSTHKLPEAGYEPPDTAVDLNASEVIALAKYLVARHAATDWLEWEDVPELSEQSFERLSFAVEQIAESLRFASVAHDMAVGIDSRYLLGRAELDGFSPTRGDRE